MLTSALLFFEFFKVGLFTFGGGLASLPFLYNICHTYQWFSENELTQLIALSNLTPGPIGLNMATFSGFKTLGASGAIIASFALILPMIIITSRVFKLYKKFNDNKFVKSVLEVLRPTSVALLAYVGCKLIYNLIFNGHLSFEFINYKSLAILVILFLMTFKFSKNPALYMFIAGLFGTIFYFIN